MGKCVICSKDMELGVTPPMVCYRCEAWANAVRIEDLSLISKIVTQIRLSGVIHNILYHLRMGRFDR